MTLRRTFVLIALPSALALSACSSSSTGGNGSTGAATHGTSSSATTASTAPAASGAPSDAAGLGALMQSAVANIKSAHISLDVNAAGQALTGSGDEKLSGGKLVAMNLVESLPGGAGSIGIIIVDGKTYAKLPPSMNNSGKPYVLVTTNSSNQVVKQLASSLDSALSSASLGSVSAFVAAADSVQNKGNQSIGGVPATHYSVIVNVAKLPPSLPGKDALTQSGLSKLPVELWIDGKGRPVQVTEAFSVQGQSVSTKVLVSKYDQPVTIAAPPASQVSTG